MNKDSYGQELILDLHNCDPTTMTRRSIRKYLIELCNKIDMEREDLHFWDDQGVPKAERETEPHLVGISGVQFIRTSSIVFHTLTLMKRVYLNIFSCKPFDPQVARQFSVEWFKGEVKNNHVMDRV